MATLLIYLIGGELMSIMEGFRMRNGILVSEANEIKAYIDRTDGKFDEEVTLYKEWAHTADTPIKLKRLKFDLRSSIKDADRVSSGSFFKASHGHYGGLMRGIKSRNPHIQDNAAKSAIELRKILKQVEDKERKLGAK